MAMLQQSAALPRRYYKSTVGKPPCEGCRGTGIFYIGSACGAGVPVDPDPANSNWLIVERCDTCEQFSSDRCAARYRYAEVRKIKCDCGFHHIIARAATEREYEDRVTQNYSASVGFVIGLAPGGIKPSEFNLRRVLAANIVDYVERFGADAVYQLLGNVTLIEEIVND